MDRTDPAAITSALLAGVLLPLCLAPVRAVVQLPSLAVAPVVVWLLMSRWARRWAAPAALGVALVEVVVRHAGRLGGSGVGVLAAVRVHRAEPESRRAGRDRAAALRDHDGRAEPARSGRATRLRIRDRASGPLLGTGAATTVGAPLGVFAVCLAAISAALSAGPDAHPDPRRRWIASVSAGFVYIVLGLVRRAGHVAARGDAAAADRGGRRAGADGHVRVRARRRRLRTGTSRGGGDHLRGQRLGYISALYRRIVLGADLRTRRPRASAGGEIRSKTVRELA